MACTDISGYLVVDWDVAPRPSLALHVRAVKNIYNIFKKMLKKRHLTVSKYEFAQICTESVSQKT